MPVDLNRGLRDVLDAAAELASARDEDAVLHVAIRRARQLMGTDLAYVMLLDPERGDTVEFEGGTAAVFDLAHRELSSTRSREGPPVDLLEQVLREVTAETERPAGPTTRQVADHVVVVTPVVTGPDHLGYVAIGGRGAFPTTGVALGRAASVIALFLLGHQARDEADNRVRGELLAELLSPGEHDLDSIVRSVPRLRSTGHSSFAWHCGWPSCATAECARQRDC